MVEKNKKEIDIEKLLFLANLLGTDEEAFERHLIRKWSGKDE